MSSLRRLLRCFPAKLLASGRPGCTVNAGVSVRCFATAQLKDIPFRVKLENDEEDRMDPEDLIVPYLTDDIRKEMFLKYMENQEEWSYENLSKTYGTSLIRTKAIILLMQKRHTMISTDQQRLRQLLDPDAPPAEEKSETKYYLEPSIEVPPTLSALYAKHVEDTKVPLSVLISAHNETLLNDGKEAERVKIGEAELKEAFRILNRHTLRAENYQEAKEDTEESIEECRSYGIRVEPFRESPSSYRTNSTSNYVNRRARHVKQSFEVNYYPSLENDENVRRAELHLLRRIEHETKAQLEHDLEYYEKVYAPLTAQERLTEIRSAPLPPALQYYEPPKPDKPMSRFKLAFQDLSTSAVAKSKTKQRIPDRTVIRTRSGQLRYATPLEEQARSWRVAPGALDRGLAMQIPHLHARLIQPYLDVDGDDQAAADLVRKRRERRKAQFAEAGITK